MTYLYTENSEIDAPMWFFHLPTFTLAQLHLNGAPGGYHLLTVAVDGFASEAALASFAATLESMSPGASNCLTTVSRADITHVLPEFLRFIPETSVPGEMFLTLAPRHGYAHVRTTEATCSHWWGGPREQTSQSISIRQAAIASDEEFLRQFPPSSF